MRLRAVLIKEGGQWVAVCLKHYVAAQGPTKREAKDALEMILMHEDVRANLRNIAPAPSVSHPGPTEFYTVRI